MPNAFIMEYCVEPSEISRALAKNPIPIEGGHASVPEEPGLGVERPGDHREIPRA